MCVCVCVCVYVCACMCECACVQTIGQLRTKVLSTVQSKRKFILAREQNFHHLWVKSCTHDEYTSRVFTHEQ